jgi:hypothetical protein
VLSTGDSGLVDIYHDAIKYDHGRLGQLLSDWQYYIEISNYSKRYARRYFGLGNRMAELHRQIGMVNG